MLLLLAACSEDFSSGKEGGVWFDDDPVAAPESSTELREPQVGFIDPRTEEYFDPDDPVRVEVLAGDPDGGSLTELSLAWSGASDGFAELPAAPGVDGMADFTLDPLPIGDYTVTVVVTDVDGLAATATQTFHVVARDADADGFEHWGLGGEDCDDENPAVNPDIAETCNGVDDDCNGTIDDGVTLVFYADTDGDGFGDALVVADFCEAQPGWVNDATDCDDTDATAFPGNPETCDGVDNDCNAEVDEGVKTTFYADTDGDSYGDPASTYDACSVPGGYVANAEDCLDSDATVSPAGTEVCFDGLDNDCDGTSNSCGIEGDIDLSTADAQFRGSNADDYAGTSVGAAGDWNNDGYADFMIGAWGNDAGGSGAGAIYVVTGGTVGVNDLDTVAVARILGGDASDGAGWAVASVGDWDADGQDDVAVAAWYDDGGGTDAGAAYIVEGGRTGDIDLSSGARTILLGEDAGDYAGYALAGGADVDGDGYDDLVVGGPGADDGGSLSGVAWLVPGPTAGAIDLSGSEATMIGESTSDQAGTSVALVGDSNGDGLGDVLVGAVGDGSGGAGAGAAYLLLGPVSGDVDLGSADLTCVGENLGDQAGYAVSTAGDTNSDGYDDFLVGAPYYDYGAADAGAAYLLLGNAHSGNFDLSGADGAVAGEGGDDGAGWAVAPAGDMDGDGDDDILVGSVLEDAGGNNAGAAYLVYGPVSGFATLLSASAKLIGEREGDYAGNTIAGVGDTNGDGKSDILVGAPYEDYGVGSRSGSAYLLLGQGI